MSDSEIVLLGTGSPLPDPNRAGPSTLIRGGISNVLCEAGRGVVMRLAAVGVIPPFLSGVILTHLHSDHISDLNDVITTYWVMSGEPTPLPIYGPAGTGDVVQGILDMLRPDISYRVAHHDDLLEGPQVEVHEVAAGDEFTVGDYRVVVGESNHRPVEPTVAYRCEREGISIVLGGDGIPCESLDNLLIGADAYVQTVIREDLVKLVPRQRFQDILDYHSTVGQAADTAERAGVRTLVLTHYVPAPPLGHYDEWRELAGGFTGQLVMGDDLTTVTVAARG